MNSLLRIGRVGTFCAVAFANLALAADLPKEGMYDVTVCLKRTITRIDYSDTRYAWTSVVSLPTMPRANFATLACAPRCTAAWARYVKPCRICGRSVPAFGQQYVYWRRQKRGQTPHTLLHWRRWQSASGGSKRDREIRRDGSERDSRNPRATAGVEDRTAGVLQPSDRHLHAKVDQTLVAPMSAGVSIRQTRWTNPRFMLVRLGAPIERIVVSNSDLRISSARSTPACPNAASPQT